MTFTKKHSSVSRLVSNSIVCTHYVVYLKCIILSIKCGGCLYSDNKQNTLKGKSFSMNTIHLNNKQAVHTFQLNRYTTYEMFNC